MRKASLVLLTFTLSIGLAVVLGGMYLRRDNAYRVKRAQEVVDEIERLEIGKSDHTVADAIAAKFGIAPPPYWLRNRYNRENCAAPDHLERCTYILLMNNSPVELLLQKHPIHAASRYSGMVGERSDKYRERNGRPIFLFGMVQGVKRPLAWVWR
jgi:hypothetical protein